MDGKTDDAIETTCWYCADTVYKILAFWVIDGLSLFVI